MNDQDELVLRNYMEQIQRLTIENRSLRLELEEARQTIEDVAIGTQIQCPTCHQWKPCMCDK